MQGDAVTGFMFFFSDWKRSEIELRSGCFVYTSSTVCMCCHIFSDARLFFTHDMYCVRQQASFDSYETEKALTLSRIKILLSKLPTDNLIFREEEEGGERRRHCNSSNFRRSLSPTTYQSPYQR